MIFKRTFHPIGHGAFYTERFYADSDNGRAICNVVFDCGCFETAKTGYSKADYENRINDAIDMTFFKGETIHAMFISHFHTDHILGVPHLLERCDVKKIFVPVLTDEVIIEAMLYNYGTYGSNKPFELIKAKKLERPDLFCEVEEVTADASTPDISQSIRYDECANRTSQPVIAVAEWYYIPYNTIHNLIDRSRLLSELGLQESASLEDITREIKRVGTRRCQEIYRRIYGEYHNSYTMTVLSYSGCGKNCVWNCNANDGCPLPRYCISNCLYMGDFEAKVDYPAPNENLVHLKSFYEKYFERVGVVQVPHHGSEHNYNEKLYEKPKICVISASRDDKYGHPDEGVMAGLRENNCITLLVTEEHKTMQEFTIRMNDRGTECHI